MKMPPYRAGYSHQFTYQEDVLIPGALEVVFITDEWKKSFQTGIVFLVFKRAMRLEYRMIKFSKLWQLCKQATAASFFFNICGFNFSISYLIWFYLNQATTINGQ